VPLGVLLHVSPQPLFSEEMDLLSNLANLLPIEVEVVLWHEREDSRLDLADSLLVAGGVLQQHVQAQVEELAISLILVLSLLVLEPEVVGDGEPFLLEVEDPSLL